MDADRLNLDCTCPSIDLETLCRSFDEDAAQDGFCRDLVGARPNLLASVPVFVRPDEIEAMAAIVTAVEAVSGLPGWIEGALSRAPATARPDPGPVGAFMGYDFHLAPDGPRLIEVNTNAGGALVNAVLARAQRRTCEAMEHWEPASPSGVEDAIVAMFREEWRRQRGDQPLTSIAVVDEAPDQQFMGPEFHLFRQLFQRAGIVATVADPAGLSWRDGRLWHGAQAVDLVYNRLCDFGLAASPALREAWLTGGAVITPNPRTHALLADKRNLVTLSDPDLLRAIGAPDPIVQTLTAGVPRTVEVTPDSADRFWSERKAWFFKPFAGYGSRAAYRGDKLTRRVWAEIAQGGFVAQALVPPGERSVSWAGETRRLKADLRLYTYAGRVLLVAARLYQGQTTNLRTEGGGFAPVWVRRRA